MNDAAPMPQSNGVWDERRLRIASDAAGIALWSWHVDTDRITMDNRAFELWGLPQKDEITFEDLSECIHPADRDRVRKAFSATRNLTGAYETDFRILHGDDFRWVSARGRGDDEGMISRIMYGVFIDVTVRKRAEEERDLVSGEMQHRIKNLFSLASALTLIAARSTETKEEMQADLAQRLRALASAHDLILDNRQHSQKAVTLNDALTILLKAYVKDQENPQIVFTAAPLVMVGDRSVTAIAMIIHELATNAAKYGALSTKSGFIDLSCFEKAGEIAVIWTETGGPASSASFDHIGFGSELMDRAIRQVDGTITRAWTDDGFSVTLLMKKALLKG